MGRPESSRRGDPFKVRLWGIEFEAPLKADGSSLAWDIPAMGKTYGVEVRPGGNAARVFVKVGSRKVDLSGDKCVRWLIDKPEAKKRELFLSNRADCVGKLLGPLSIHPATVRAVVTRQDPKASSFRGQNFDIEQEGMKGFEKTRGAMHLESQIVARLTGVSEAEINAFLHYETRFDLAAVNLELGKTLLPIRQTGMYKKWVKKDGVKVAERQAIEFIQQHGFGDRGIGHFFKGVELQWDRKKKEYRVDNVAGEGETWQKLTTEGEFAYIWKQIFGDKPVPRRGQSYFADVLATACLMRKDSQRYNLPLQVEKYYPKARRLAYRGLGNLVAELKIGKSPIEDDEPGYASLVNQLRGQLLAMKQ